MKRPVQCAEQQHSAVTLEHHQILGLPRQMALMIDPHRAWKVQYNARSNRRHLPTSLNIAPPQKWLSWWSLAHMKRPVYIAPEQQESPSNIAKYYPSHKKRHAKIFQQFSENGWNVIYNVGTVREWSEHEPVSPQPAPRLRLLFGLTTRSLYYRKCDILRSGYPWIQNLTEHWACHRLTSPNIAPATKVTVELDQILDLPRQVTWSNRWTSPNIALATKVAAKPLLLFFVTLSRTSLNWYLTELVLDWTVTLMKYFLFTVLDSPVAWLNWSFSE